MDTLTRLKNLVGKQGFLQVGSLDDVEFMFVDVIPANPLPEGTDEDSFLRAIIHSSFTVRFNEGMLFDGSNTRVVSGRYMSLIRGAY